MNPIVLRVAARYEHLYRIAATIDKSVVDKWRKDLRMMTKIYRAVPEDLAWDAPPEEKAKHRERWDEAQTLFRQFQMNFTEWAYKRLLPKVDKDQTPWLHKIVMETVWSFKHDLSSTTLFPVLYPSNDPDLSKFRHERERNIKRYQGTATKALDAIDEYLDGLGGKVERREQVEHVEVGGVQVVILNWGRGDGNVELEEHFHKSMNLLRERIAKIKQAGFPGAVKGLTVTMDFDQKEWDTNGMYRPASDELIIFPIGLYGADTGHGTFTHECGHRFYFRELPGQARAHWEEVMESRGLKITTDDVHRFTNAVLRQYDPSTPAILFGDEERLKAALPEARDEGDEVKFKELARLPLRPINEEGPFRPEKYVDFMKTKVDEVVQLEEITDYGNTNPMEAFAECFRLWVLKGPGALKPWTRNFFREVSRAGGAKIATHLAWRYGMDDQISGFIR